MLGEMPRSGAMFGGRQASLPDENTLAAVEALEDENKMLRAVIDNFPGGILLYDKNLKLVLCNEQQKALLEYPPALFEYGLPSLEQIFRFNAVRGEYGPGDIEEHVRERMRLAERREPHAFERMRPNGTILEVRGTPLEGGGFVTTYLDVTALRAGKGAAGKTQEPMLAGNAENHDRLTGLPNWSIFEDRFQQILARVRRGQVAAVQFIDLDHYRDARRKLGAGGGDRLLLLVAERLCNVARAADAIARIGDDEFIVLQTDVDRPSSVAKLSHRIVAAIKQPYQIGKFSVTLGASIGVALAPRDGLEAETLIAKAREALDRTRLEADEQVAVND